MSRYNSIACPDCPPRGGRLPAGVAARARARTMVAKLHALLKAWQHRRAVSRLAAFDERALRDLGISRSDVSSALSLPLSDDPSEKLAAVREERRAAATAHRRAWRRAAERAQ